MNNIVQTDLFDQEKGIKETLDSKIPQIIDDNESPRQYWLRYGEPVGEAGLIYYHLDPRIILVRMVKAGFDVGCTIKEIRKLPYKQADSLLYIKRRELENCLVMYNQPVLRYLEEKNKRLGLSEKRFHTLRR